jgi:hypothetical protein
MLSCKNVVWKKFILQLKEIAQQNIFSHFFLRFLGSQPTVKHHKPQAKQPCTLNKEEIKSEEVRERKLEIMQPNREVRAPHPFHLFSSFFKKIELRKERVERERERERERDRKRVRERERNKISFFIF